MSAGDRRSAFAARPVGPDAWVRAAAAPVEAGPSKGDQFTARLTIDITPALRGRIKVAAFRRGLTVADMLRAMLDEAFQAEPPGTSDSRP